MRWRRSNWLKITAIVVVITFAPVQTAFARGRRGGGGGGVAVAAIEGAAMAVMGASSPGIAYGMAAGNIAGAGLAAGGVDPHTSALISAGVSGLTGGIYGVGAGHLVGAAAAGRIAGSMVGSLTSAEVGYQLNEAGVPFSGIIGSLAGGFAGGFTEGAISYYGYTNPNDFGWSLTEVGKNTLPPISVEPNAHFATALSTGLQAGFNRAIGPNGSNLLHTVVSGVVSDVVNDAMRELAGENSPALRYIGYAGQLAGTTAGGLSTGLYNYALNPPNIADKVQKYSDLPVVGVPVTENGETYLLQPTGSTNLFTGDFYKKAMVREYGLEQTTLPNFEPRYDYLQDVGTYQQ